MSALESHSIFLIINLKIGSLKSYLTNNYKTNDFRDAIQQLMSEVQYFYQFYFIFF